MDNPTTELPYHRWPRSYGGWQAGSIIRCEGEDCQWCKARWKLVDPHTLEDVKEQRPNERNDQGALWGAIQRIPRVG